MVQYPSPGGRAGAPFAGNGYVLIGGMLLFVLAGLCPAFFMWNCKFMMWDVRCEIANFELRIADCGLKNKELGDRRQQDETETRRSRFVSAFLAVSPFHPLSASLRFASNLK